MVLSIMVLRLSCVDVENLWANDVYVDVPIEIEKSCTEIKSLLIIDIDAAISVFRNIPEITDSIFSEVIVETLLRYKNLISSIKEKILNGPKLKILISKYLLK